MNAVLADGSIVSVDKDKTTYEDGRSDNYINGWFLDTTVVK